MEWIVLAVGAAVAIRIAMHFVDTKRIREDIEGKGGRIVSIKWNPFGRGWFFEKNERHYAVTFVDRSGASRSVDCKTSLFTGVYWTEPQEIEKPRPQLVSRHRCSQCGYSLSREWRACPNCGKATEFA